MTSRFEKIHPVSAFCYKRRDGRVSLFIFTASSKLEFRL